MNDAQLLNEYARRGSEEAFASLVERYSPLVYSACLRILSDRHAAEDAVQAVFIALSRKARRVRAASLAAWLHRAASLAARQLRRERTARQGREREAARMISEAVKKRTWDSLRPELDRAVAGLPTRYREVVTMHYLVGLPVADTAVALGKPTGTVKSLLSRAVDKLRVRLGCPLSAAVLAGLLSERAVEAVPPGLASTVTAAVTGSVAPASSVLLATEGIMKGMTLMKVKLVAALLCVVTVAGGGGTVLVNQLAAAESGKNAPAPMNPKVKSAPANTWVKLAEEPTGGRAWPMFYYDPGMGRFVLSGGDVGRKPHFDTEMFDAGAAKWTNAYPAGATYKNVSGPTDAPGVGFRDDGAMKANKDGVMRFNLGVNPYCWEPGSYFQWARNRDNGRFYAYFKDCTLVFDPQKRTWADLKAKRFSKGKSHTLLYGSLAYDPVNKEIISFGGTSDESGGSPGTWAFNVAANSWKKVPSVPSGMTKLNAEVESLRAVVAALGNACRNRYHCTESAVEAKRDLAAGAKKLAAASAELSAKVKGAGLAGAGKTSAGVAAGELEKVAARLQSLAGGLVGKLSVSTLLGLQASLESAQAAERALDVEPCGRGISQLAVDQKNGKIVLFGGCRLDSYLADTWVYDCKSRRWEQRWPKLSPAPRGGHTLARLPKSGKLVLYGNAIFSSGYGVPHGNPRPPRDLWTYDLVTNHWKLLAGPAGAGKGPVDGIGAVDTNDVLVVVSHNARNRRARITWGMRVNPAAPDAGSAKAGAKPGAVTTCFNTPTDFDKAAKPKPQEVAKLIKGASANTWTLLPPSPKKPNEHPWGTSFYDSKRSQLLSWGGGHCAWHYNDMSHYSIRAGTRSIGYPDEYPFRSASFKGFFNQSFNNRPMIPTHLWDAAAYDPVGDRVVFSVRGKTWTYDPARRDWDYPPAAPVHPRAGALHVALGSTPRGAVCWRSENLYLFDAKGRTWKKLPLSGGKIGGAYGDTTGICYDSKRNCLWLANNGSPMLQYDMATGKVSTTQVPGAPELVWMRDTAYIPELDMLLNSARDKGPGGEVGNLAYDIAGKKWVGLVIPCSDGKPRTHEKPYARISLALHYDAKLKVAVFLHASQEILVLRASKAGLKTFAPKMRKPRKR